MSAKGIGQQELGCEKDRPAKWLRLAEGLCQTRPSLAGTSGLKDKERVRNYTHAPTCTTGATYPPEPANSLANDLLSLPAQTSQRSVGHNCLLPAAPGDPSKLTLSRTHEAAICSALSL